MSYIESKDKIFFLNQGAFVLVYCYSITVQIIEFCRRGTS